MKTTWDWLTVMTAAPPETLEVDWRAASSRNTSVSLQSHSVSASTTVATSKDAESGIEWIWITQFQMQQWYVLCRQQCKANFRDSTHWTNATLLSQIFLTINYSKEDQKKKSSKTYMYVYVLPLCSLHKEYEIGVAVSLNVVANWKLDFGLRKKESCTTPIPTSHNVIVNVLPTVAAVWFSSSQISTWTT